jgi:hypothetical protein
LLEDRDCNTSVSFALLHNYQRSNLSAVRTWKSASAHVCVLTSWRFDAFGSATPILTNKWDQSITDSYRCYFFIASLNMSLGSSSNS